MKLEVADLVALFKVIREYRVKGGIGQKSLTTVSEERRKKLDIVAGGGDYGDDDEDTSHVKEAVFKPIPPELVKWKKVWDVWVKVDSQL